MLWCHSTVLPAARYSGVWLHHSVLVMDAYVSPADSTLVRREIETLEHFRICKPDNPLDEELIRGGRYSYEPVDYEVFGCKIEGIPINRDSSFLSSLFEEEEET